MYYILRIIASPFILGLILVAHIFYSIKRTLHFIKYGGEFINYDKDERATIQKIYEEMKLTKKD